MMTSRDPIELTYLNGTGFCFNVDDYMTIRTEYRIVGSLVGTCNVRGWTPDVNGLPAEFNCFETQLLIEKGFIRLVGKNSLCAIPSDEQRINYEAFREKRINEQESILKREKLKESEKNIDKIMKGKRKKLLQKGVNEKDINLTSEEILKEIADGIEFDRGNALLDIPCQHPFDHEQTTIQWTKITSLKYEVFCDLWSKGFYVTSGEGFGADFLAYPGDPMMFHASHIVIVLDNPKIAATEFIAKGRLAVTVNKFCTFVYRSSSSCVSNTDSESTLENKQNFVYQTLRWEGCKENDKNMQR